MPDTNIPANTDGATARRRRYERARPQDTFVALTPVKLTMLRFLAELRFLSLPQLARLCCPAERRDLSEKSARRHLRALFDAELVDVLPVSRAALAPTNAPNDASLLYGSAPNVYTPTVQALRLLCRAGLIGEEMLKRPVPAYGPRNSLFLSHELAVRDVRVWLETAARDSGHGIECWRDGEAAAIHLGETRFSEFVRPDCWFVYRLGAAVLVGLVEVDQGTERGERRWAEKLGSYAALFAGGALREATGYVNARVLVICPDARRADALAGLVERRADPALAGRFWLAGRDALERPDLCRCDWRRVDRSLLHPLLSSKLPA